MILIRFLPALAIIVFVVYGENTTQKAPCDESGGPLPTSTPSTVAVCGDGSWMAFKRKNGWWCISKYFPALPGGVVDGQKEYYPQRHDSTLNCQLNLKFVTSFETEEEWATVHANIRSRYPFITALWIGVGYNETSQQYYWNDGVAVPTLVPQPKVVDQNGQVAWVINRDPNVPGYGSLQVVDPDGGFSKNVSVPVYGAICARPGKQIN